MDSNEAYFVEADDFDEWKKALIDLQNKEKRDFFAENVYDKFINNYSWYARVETLLKSKVYLSMSLPVYIILAFIIILKRKKI